MSGLVPDGLSVRRDGGDVLTGDSGVCHDPDRRIGQPGTEVEVEAAVFGRRAAAQRGAQTRPLAVGVRPREIREELDINAPIAGIAKAGHRGADSVERSSRHQPDDDARRHAYRSLIGGGASFVTRRITPPFCAINFCASSRETPFFCITIASLKLSSA